MYWNITLTPEQDAAIVAKWNELAKADRQVDPGFAHVILDMNDNLEIEMEETGSATIEVGMLDSKTGNPITFEIYTSEVDIEIMDDDGNVIEERPGNSDQIQKGARP